jgi:hypothetical protein
LLKGIEKRRMNDPNVIYGGDYEGTEDVESVSLGELITRNLKRGASKHGFVSVSLNFSGEIEINSTQTSDQRPHGRVMELR